MQYFYCLSINFFIKINYFFFLIFFIFRAKYTSLLRLEVARDKLLACKGAVGVNSKGDPTVTGRIIIVTRK